MSGEPKIGVLGGSGLDELDGLEGAREVSVTTPWGEPSSPPVVGRFADRTVIFIPRHGRGHRRLPSEINYRANICAASAAEPRFTTTASVPPERPRVARERVPRFVPRPAPRSPTVSAPCAKDPPRDEHDNSFSQHLDAIQVRQDLHRTRLRRILLELE